MESANATLTTALGDGLQQMAVNIMDMAVLVVPIALTIWGAILGIGYAKKFFAKVAK